MRTNKTLKEETTMKRKNRLLRKSSVACALAIFTVLFTQVETVQAQRKLYVDVAASPGGDGSKQAPFRRITDAVNYVRGFPLGRGFEILVEPGTYVGRYSNTDPSLEDLPIVLDYPNLKLKG